jgi:hypothetical protein
VHPLLIHVFAHKMYYCVETDIVPTLILLEKLFWTITESIFSCSHYIFYNACHHFLWNIRVHVVVSLADHKDQSYLRHTITRKLKVISQFKQQGTGIHNIL